MNDFHYYIYDFWANNEVLQYNEIFDTTAADWSNMSYSDLITISQKAGEVKAIDTDTKFSWVVNGSDVKELTDFYKSAKILQTEKSRILCAFNNYDEAMQWVLA